jgi:hypothetical protein
VCVGALQILCIQLVRVLATDAVGQTDLGATGAALRILRAMDAFPASLPLHERAVRDGRTWGRGAVLQR